MRHFSNLSKRLKLLSTTVKFLWKVDDALDLFAEHAIGGIVGLFMNGLFGTTEVIALDGVNTTELGGFMDHNWKQLYIQVAYICAACSYSFIVTAIIAKGINVIPGLKLRSTPEDECLGIDEVEVCDLAKIHNRYACVLMQYNHPDWRIRH